MSSRCIKTPKGLECTNDKNEDLKPILMSDQKSNKKRIYFKRDPKTSKLTPNNELNTQLNLNSDANLQSSPVKQPQSRTSARARENSLNYKQEPIKAKQ